MVVGVGALHSLSAGLYRAVVLVSTNRTMSGDVKEDYSAQTTKLSLTPSSTISMKKEDDCSEDNRSLWDRIRSCCRTFLALMKNTPTCCWIFCCPPFPSQMIRKMAFHPPTSALYHFATPDGKLQIRKPTSSTRHLFPLELKLETKTVTKWLESAGCGSETILKPEEIRQFQGFFAQTSRGKWIACLYYACPVPPAKFTILFSHPNAGDLSMMMLRDHCPSVLAVLLQCNVCVYDYSGYGISTGRASEKNLYADIRGVYTALMNRFALKPSDIILMGQSLGTAASVDLAREATGLAGVILIAGFASALHILDNSLEGKCRNRLKRCEQFNSLHKIKEVHAPVLVIHGTEDEFVPRSHGMALYMHAKNAVPPLWIQDGLHNNLMAFSQFWTRIQYFVSHDLKGGVLHAQKLSRLLTQEMKSSGIWSICKGSKTCDCTRYRPSIIKKTRGKNAKIKMDQETLDLLNLKAIKITDPAVILKISEEIGDGQDQQSAFHKAHPHSLKEMDSDPRSSATYTSNTTPSSSTKSSFTAAPEMCIRPM